MLVRSAAPSDRDATVDLWERAGLTRPWNDPVADFDRAVDGATSTVLVGVDHSGAVSATVMVGHDGHRGWMYYLAVDPDRRGRGLGRRIVVEAELWLRSVGAVKVQLMVRGTNGGAAAFYERLGYEVADVQVLARWLHGTGPNRRP